MRAAEGENLDYSPDPDSLKYPNTHIKLQPSKKARERMDCLAGKIEWDVSTERM